MKVNGTQYRTVWLKAHDPAVVQIIDQTKLPHFFVIADLRSVADVAHAIREMHIRGAPAIGAAAAYGMYLAALKGEDLERAALTLKATRPTAINLAWAVDQQLAVLVQETGRTQRTELAKAMAQRIADDDVESCRKIGGFGVELIRKVAATKGGVVNILTHCNAGWLACVDYGTATAPIYLAHQQGIPVHVWVSETRPRNQGAQLTAWELGQEGVPHTLIVDNAAGLLMQRGQVDLVLVGSDRTTVTGDVANKIGTYLKAVAAHEHNIPFYVALPSSTIDWNLSDGVQEIPIEERSQDEVRMVEGLGDKGVTRVLVTAPETKALNYGFDVTPANFVSALITERGVVKAERKSICALFPENSVGALR